MAEGRPGVKPQSRPTQAGRATAPRDVRATRSNRPPEGQQARRMAAP